MPKQTKESVTEMIKEMSFSGEKRLRNLRRVRWLFIPLYIFWILIPAYHTLSTEIPPLEKLNLSSGAFFYKKTKGLGTLIVLNENGSLNEFTCRRNLLIAKRHDCITEGNQSNRDDSLIGKEASVWWFEQNIYLWFTQRRLVRLVVDGYEKYSYQKAVMRNESTKSNSLSLAIEVLIAFIVMLILLERTVRRQLHEESKHG